MLEASSPAPPDWLLTGLPWIVLVFGLLLAACAVALWMLVAHARGLERLERRLAVLEELAALLRKLTSEREDIDLRRLEHVVIDIRDGQKRTEDVLLRAVEAQVKQAAGGRNGKPSAALPGPTLGERVVNRMLALGYERVQIVSPPESIARLSDADGEILVEAHRQGALHKGRVLVRSGTISDVELQPSYSIFP
jgi:hypothetical protein